MSTTSNVIAVNNVNNVKNVNNVNNVKNHTPTTGERMLACCYAA
jgi:hypothetical protein